MRKAIDFGIISKSRTEVMGITILAALLYHAHIVWPESRFVAPIKFLFRDSVYVTLDVLLFCSAYGLVRSRLTNPIPWSRFLYRRFIRVLPAYLLVMAALTAYEMRAGRSPGQLNALLRFLTLGFWFGKQGPLAAEWFVPTVLALYSLFPVLFTGYEAAGNKKAFVVWAIIGALLLSIGPVLANRPNLLMFTTRISAFVLGIDVGYRVFGRSAEPRSTTVARAILIAVLCYAAVAVLFLLTTDSQRGRYGLYWPLFIPAIVPLGLLWSESIAAMKTERWRKIAKPITWLLGFCGTYALEIIVLHEPLYSLSWVLSLLSARTPRIGQALDVINRGRYFEFAVYAVAALALAPWLSRAVAWIRRGADAIFDREPGAAPVGR